MRPKILVLTTTFPRWRDDSTPSFILNLCEQLSNNFKIIVLAPHHNKAKLEENIGKIKVYRFPYFFPFNLQKLCYEGGILPNMRVNLLAKIQVPFLLLFELIFACKLVKKERPVLIHAHWSVPSGITAVIIKNIFNLPVLITAHGADVFSHNMGIKFLNYFVKKYADFITVNSRFTKKTFLSTWKKSPNVSIVPMGVSNDKFKPKPKKEIQEIKNRLGFGNKQIILFVGRLVEKKGVDYLIKAMPTILQQSNNVYLLIIGFGPEEKKLKDLVKRLKLEKEVKFIGKLANERLPQYYQLADVCVAPSILDRTGDTEGLGVVLLEAMACGTPVVGTNIGGISDVIKNNKNGLLVVQKNPELLAKAVIRLLTNEKLKERLVRNGLKYIGNDFKWNIVAQKFNKIYQKLL